MEKEYSYEVGKQNLFLKPDEEVYQIAKDLSREYETIQSKLFNI